MSVEEFRAEVASKERFEFGKNWRNFITKLNDGRIQQAELSLKKMLEVDTVEGKSFLDIGSGSGLFSLAARNLGANVTSFDYDESSVWCTNELNKRYHSDDQSWTVMHGSVLDTEFLATLGEFDFVYSWGVLHHTGDMWRALENTCKLVKPRGTLFIAIYNYQPILTPIWKKIKYLYNIHPHNMFLNKSIQLRNLLTNILKSSLNISFEPSSSNQ